MMLACVGLMQDKYTTQNDQYSDPSSVRPDTCYTRQLDDLFVTVFSDTLKFSITVSILRWCKCERQQKPLFFWKTTHLKINISTVFTKNSKKIFSTVFQRQQKCQIMPFTPAPSCDFSFRTFNILVQVICVFSYLETSVGPSFCPNNNCRNLFEIMFRLTMRAKKNILISLKS